MRVSSCCRPCDSQGFCGGSVSFEGNGGGRRTRRKPNTEQRGNGDERRWAVAPRGARRHGPLADTPTCPGESNRAPSVASFLRVQPRFLRPLHCSAAKLTHYRTLNSRMRVAEWGSVVRRHGPASYSARRRTIGSMLDAVRAGLSVATNATMVSNSATDASVQGSPGCTP